MWRCPQCGEEVQDVFDACWHCGSGRDGPAAGDFQAEPDDPSVPDPGPEPEVPAPGPEGGPTPPPADRPVTIVTYDVASQADLERSCLESEGIPTFLADSHVAASCSNAVGGVKLQVAASDAERAKTLLERHRASRSATQDAVANQKIRFLCETCGEIITFPVQRCGHVEVCPECSSYVDVPDRAERMLPMEPAASAPGVVPDAKGTDEPRDPSPGSRTDSQLWIEVIAVLCLGYLPNLFSALSSLFERNPVRHSFVNEELSRIVMALAISAPLLVIMALGRDPWSVFGIVRPRWLMDALAGGMILVVAFVAGIWGAGVLPPTDNSIAAPMQRPEGVAAICLLAVSCTAGAFAEELVMRGYLIPRLARLLRSTWMAVVASTVLFASYHIYQGLASMVGVAAMGLVYAVSFCLLRRLWPVCAAHSIHNFLVFL